MKSASMSSEISFNNYDFDPERRMKENQTVYDTILAFRNSAPFSSFDEFFKSVKLRFKLFSNFNEPLVRFIWQNASADKKEIDAFLSEQRIDLRGADIEKLGLTHKQKVILKKREPEFQSDCLYELEDKLENHRERLEEWKRKHPQATKTKDMNKSLNNSIIIAAIIIGVSIIIAAWVSRPSAARYRSMGNYRVLDTQTGKVHEAD